MMTPQTVVVHRDGATTYPQIPPFHPSVSYPESPFAACGSEPNSVYAQVRETFCLSGLDADNFETLRWNPLRELIRPGETVLLKPNMVKEFHPRDPDGWKYVLTHGSVIRAVCDYVWKALDGQGKVIVADAPQTDSSFSQMVRLLGLDAIQQFYRSHNLNFELIDLRLEEWESREGVVLRRRKLPGDPNGCVAYNLGQESEFVNHPGTGRYYGADYDVEGVNYHHSQGRHEYLIAGTAIKSDVIFNLPKLKTHKKAGITVSLKNLVGINGDKNWLPHHTEGSPRNGGDEHPAPDIYHRTERMLIPFFRELTRRVPLLGPLLHRRAKRFGISIFGDTEEVIRSGNWAGNDTIWRMCLDLNKIIMYGNADGTMREAELQQRKRHYVLVDGIIAGEGRGPMNPDPVQAGTLIFGLHPASVDAACAYLMGFAPECIPIVRQAFRCHHFSLTEWDWKDINVISNNPDWNGHLPNIAHDSTFHFEPHFGWKGQIERHTMRKAGQYDEAGNLLFETSDSVTAPSL